ncbi:hypothetical protein [Sphingomonas jeddahensis]|uniref:Chain length determinant protein n=1 Tax=Sphingomonas jeddahensis TaxID=1915074 RepID=A0A1V2EU58_9SPHN|nr:hypothetical protein [Sphingomonas jeddahensis]ONF96093.1 hypothetical protein SPHI_17080 [Sphingomonas jeddahensis]
MVLGLIYLRVILSRWKLVLALIALCTLTAWAVSVFYLATKPKFESSARLNIVPTSEELGYATRFVRGSTFDGGSVLLGTYAEFAHTRPVVEPIVDRYIAEAAAAQGQTPAQWLAANTGTPGFSPGRILAILNYGEAPVVPLREEIIEEVIKATTIETVEGTYLLQLTVEWEDPKSAAWFANALSDAIIARAERASRSTGQEIAGSLEARLAAKRAELAGTLRQSRGLKSSIGVVDLDRQKTALLEARLTEQAQLTTDRAALDAAKSQVAALRRQSGGKLTGAQNTVEQTLAVEAPRAAGLEQSVAIRTGRIGQIDRQIASLGTVEDRVKTLDDRAALLQQEVNALTERVSFSQTENLANGPRIQLIERAKPPLTRSSPKIFFNTVLGFIAGCALAACALLLLGPAKPKDEDEASQPERTAQDRPVTAEPLPTTNTASTMSDHPGEGRGPVSDGPQLAPDLRQDDAEEKIPEPAPARPQPTPLSLVTPGLTRGLAPFSPNAGEGSGASDQARSDEESDGPLTIGNTALKPCPRPEPIADFHFPGTLPRPRNGQSYTGNEIAAIKRQFGTWLFEQLAADARGLYIAAIGQEQDARQLAQLTHSLLLKAGIQLAVVDGRQGGARATKPGKPFVYLGRLDAVAARDGLAAMPDSAHLLLATRSGDPADWRHELDCFLPRPAHVVAFD